MKEKFKLFVRTMPNLSSYVEKGDTTWQKLYENYVMYGEESSIWEKYKESKKEESEITLSSIINSIKNIDMDEMKKGIESASKIVALLQGLVPTKESVNTYRPRNIFKRYDD